MPRKTLHMVRGPQSTKLWIIELSKSLQLITQAKLNLVETSIVDSLEWLKTKKAEVMPTAEAECKKRKKLATTGTDGGTNFEAQSANNKAPTPHDSVATPNDESAAKITHRQAKARHNQKEEKPFIEPAMPGEAEDESCADQLHEAADEQVSAKDKGTRRPRGKGRASVLASATEVKMTPNIKTPATNTSLIATTIPPSQTTIKRPRGRPRKNRTDMTNSSAISSVVATPKSDSGSCLPMVASAGGTMRNDHNLLTPLKASEPAQQEGIDTMWSLNPISSTPLRSAVPIPAKFSAKSSKKSSIQDLLNGVGTEPKIESWTSRFLQRPVPAVPEVPTKYALKPPVKTASPWPKTPGGGKTPPEDAVVVVVAPPTTSRKRGRPPMPVPESPLTRAKRIDAENTWREEQLKVFLSSKAENLKSAVASLKTPDEKRNSHRTNNARLPSVMISPTMKKEEAPSILPPQPASNPIELPKAVPQANVVNIAPPADSSAATPIEEESPPRIPPSSPSSSLEEAEAENAQPTELSNEAQATLAQPSSSELKNAQKRSSTNALQKNNVDIADLERKKRLKERNDRAVEKKRALAQKALELRQNQLADLTGKPPKLPGKRANIAPSQAARTISHIPVPLHKQQQQNGSSNMSLQKQVMINNATKTTNESGIFRMPLPKVKSPSGKSPGKPGNEHPSSDETFSMMPSVHPKVAPGSPKFPDILSDEDETKLGSLPTNDARRPAWAMTPELRRSLSQQQQRSIKPEDIFGEVQPVKLEDFFKDSGRKFTRNRNSAMWHS